MILGEGFQSHGGSVEADAVAPYFGVRGALRLHGACLACFAGLEGLQAQRTETHNAVNKKVAHLFITRVIT